MKAKETDEGCGCMLLAIAILLLMAGCQLIPIYARKLEAETKAIEAANKP